MFCFCGLPPFFQYFVSLITTFGICSDTYQLLFFFFLALGPPPPPPPPLTPSSLPPLSSSQLISLLVSQNSYYLWHMFRLLSTTFFFFFFSFGSSSTWIHVKRYIFPCFVFVGCPFFSPIFCILNYIWRFEISKFLPSVSLFIHIQCQQLLILEITHKPLIDIYLYLPCL